MGISHGLRCMLTMISSRSCQLTAPVPFFLLETPRWDTYPGVYRRCQQDLSRIQRLSNQRVGPPESKTNPTLSFCTANLQILAISVPRETFDICQYVSHRMPAPPRQSWKDYNKTTNRHSPPRAYLWFNSQRTGLPTSSNRLYFVAKAEHWLYKSWFLDSIFLHFYLRILYIHTYTLFVAQRTASQKLLAKEMKNKEWLSALLRK